MPVELRHKPGKLMHSSDFASRHPSVCSSLKCQICSFVRDWEDVGDKAANIKSVTIEDVQSGRSLMLMTQKLTWKSIQARDRVHMKLKQLISTQQLPNSKKTKGDNTKIKLLHNQYTQGKLYVDHDDMVMIKSPVGHYKGSVILIPPSLFPGITNALHIQLGHPSKAQLSSLMARFFYTPGGKAIIDDITDHCYQCATVRCLPKVLLEDTTSPSSGLCSKFSIDVIERFSQKLLVIREDLSQFIRVALIKDQTCPTLRDSILQPIADMIPEGGTELRVDGATGFQALQSESETPGSTFKKLNIKVTIGRLLNKNKNPTAENSNKELLKEILRYSKSPGPVTSQDLAIIVRNYNSRIRYHSYSSKEIIFRRNIADNKPLDIHDDEIAEKQQQNRKSSSKSSSKNKSKHSSPTPEQKFNIGDLVLVRNEMSKISPRKLHIIEGKEDKFFLIRKLGNRLRNRLYRALPDELVVAPSSTTINPSPEDPSSETHQPLDKLLDKTDKTPVLTRSGRPMRKAALKAHGINTLDVTKKKFAYGWLTEDQYSDDDVPIYVTYEASTSPTTSDSSQSTRDSDTSTLSSDTECDLDWDSSPEATALSDPSYHTPPAQSISSKLPPPFPNQRKHAISARPLVRTNAFRTPADHLSQTSPPTTRRHQHPSAAPSKLPRPVVPSQVDLHAVNDLSNVLPQHSPAPRQTPQLSLVYTRSRRNLPTVNYRLFQESGRKNDRQGDEDPEKRSRDVRPGNSLGEFQTDTSPPKQLGQ